MNERVRGREAYPKAVPVIRKRLIPVTGDEQSRVGEDAGGGGGWGAKGSLERSISHLKAPHP